MSGGGGVEIKLCLSSYPGGMMAHFIISRGRKLSLNTGGGGGGGGGGISQ